MNVAILPARQGSKRVPGKNIRALAGRPIIEYPIRTALDSGIFDRVIVSTDGDDIARVATDCGAEVPFMRPEHLADDMTTTSAVLRHATEWLVDNGATDLTSVCCIYPTAAMVLPDDLKQAYDRFGEGDWAFVFSAVDLGGNVMRGLRRRPDGGVQMLFETLANTRTQDLESVFVDAGCFYFGRPDAWRDEVPIFGANSTFVDIAAWRAPDIDTEEDWQRAESVFAFFQDRYHAGKA